MILYKQRDEGGNGDIGRWRKKKRFGNLRRTGEVGQETEAAKDHQRRKAFTHTKRILMSYCSKETQVSTAPGPGNWLVTWKRTCHVLGQLVLLLGLPSLVHWLVWLALLCGTFEIPFPLANQPCVVHNLYLGFLLFWGWSTLLCRLFLKASLDNSYSFHLPVQCHFLNYLWGNKKPVPILIINASASSGGHVC